ncbi:MAG: hypothetical protein KC478_07915 [Bacteriovoracaceae bacterium]|nr:hypothetical protein [Bacteriovoracaceae bacterium]
MSLIKYKNQFFASCPPGLEPFLKSELESLGAKSLEETTGGIHFESFPEIAIKAILYSRVASRVYKKLYSFEIKTEKDLYYEMKDIKWKAVFDLEQTFKIQILQGKSPDGNKRSKFKNAMYLGQVSKDAIVDCFRKDTGHRPDVDKEYPDAPLLLRIEPNNNRHSQKETVTVALDMCGKALSFRGYRRLSVEAPLRENLAAGMVLKAGLKKNEDFYNPMCGSGTILIEGLMIKGDIPPSYIKVREYHQYESKEWSFLDQNFYAKDKYLVENTKKLFKEVADKASKGIEALESSKSQNVACEIDEKSLKAARSNLDTAGLYNVVKLVREDATVFGIKDFKGKVIANPPYGERLKQEELESLYRDFGEKLKNSFKGSEAYILTANFPMIKKIQLKTAERMIIHNGNLESRLVRYNLY